jgi:Skp family chaperone for outer membrane proteins
MRIARVILATIGVLLAIVGGFALVQAVRDDKDMQQRIDAEIESERQQFIDGARERVANLTREMNDLEDRADKDSPYASADERAEWSQQLFELKQQRARLEAELDRAHTATAEEWKAMRGPLGRTLDTLEAAAQKLRHDVPVIFAIPDQEPPEHPTDAEKGAP